MIATRNRATHLREHLPTVVASLQASGLDFELLVVDNGSTDATGAVIDEIASHDPRLRRIVAGPGGQCRGRNLAMSLARGRVILFTDDDVAVPLGWAAQLSAPILAGDADAVSGEIRVAEHLKRPWMTPNTLVHFGELGADAPPWIVERASPSRARLRSEFASTRSWARVPSASATMT